MSPKIDIVYPCHSKDKDTLVVAIEFAKKNVKNLNNIYYVSKHKLTDDATWISEDIFPFTYNDMINKIGNHWRSAWYYAGWIHLYSSICIPNTLDHVLICDSDTVFCNPVEFIDENNNCLFNISPSDGTPLYFEHMEKLVKGLTPQLPRPWSCISHHMVINKKILLHMMDTVEKIHNKPFWEAWIDVTKENYSTAPRENTPGYIGNDRHKNGPGRATSYELYCQYALKYFKNDVKIRKLDAILAYKGFLNVKGETFKRDFGSRTNLRGNRVQIIPTHIENEHEFDTLIEALRFHSLECAKQGYQQVTFQNHTREGSGSVTGNSHGDKR